ncbi:hypothetical protein IM511_08235 [Erythrobacteraceae bacterium E2-1 Yellow Sea]|nr:hypothetical protein [Erythrobacteraceae bacterium E2-1 Yellow Sea]
MSRALALAGTMLVGCGPALAEGAEYSALDEIAELRPVIACIAEHVRSSSQEEVWSGGVPVGPATDQAVLTECVKLGGLSQAHVSQQEGTDLLQSVVLTMALMSFGDARDHLTAEDFDSAVELAACVESAVLADETAFAEGIIQFESMRAAQLSCGLDLVKLVQNPELGTRSDLLGFQISRANLVHIGRKLGALEQPQERRMSGGTPYEPPRVVRPPSPPPSMRSAPND